MNTKHKSHSLQSYGVTRGRLPQMAGLPGLNGGGAAAAVLPPTMYTTVCIMGMYHNLTAAQCNLIISNYLRANKTLPDH